ncbi:MAG: hypothetical protein ACI3T9_04555 [Romboutsia timonensis]
MCDYIQSIVNEKFMEYVKVQGMSGKDAIMKLDWEIFVHHADKFNALNEQQQWAVRKAIDAYHKIYGFK